MFSNILTGQAALAKYTLHIALLFIKRINSKNFFFGKSRIGVQNVYRRFEIKEKDVVTLLFSFYCDSSCIIIIFFFFRLKKSSVTIKIKYI